MTPASDRARCPRAWPRNRAFRAGVALAVMLTSSCGDSLLNVDRTDLVLPESLTDAAGLTTLYNGAIGDVILAIHGGTGGGGATGYADNVVTAGALLSDEAYASDTGTAGLERMQFDQRTVAAAMNGAQNGIFLRLHRARVALETAAARLDGSAHSRNSADKRTGEVLALAGYSYTAFGENFCSGVPFSSAPEGGDLVLGGPQTTQQIFQLAIERFDSAFHKAAGDAAVTNLTRVGKGRAQLNAGDFAGAAATVSSVPTTFLYKLYHSASATLQFNPSVTPAQIYTLENGFNAASAIARRLGVANREGTNGLDFRDAADPRVQVTRNPLGGFDAVSPLYTVAAYATTGDRLDRATGFPLATGIEARLIEAEAALKEGNSAGMLNVLNALRARVAGLTPLTDPGSPAARENLLFRERAFWLFATGHRLGDLRRLVRQYGRVVTSVFPVGPYVKGGTYGSETGMLVPMTEQSYNRNSTGCLDRNP